MKTVKIVAENKHGYMIINECDYDADKHELCEGEVVKSATSATTVDELSDQSEKLLAANQNLTAANQKLSAANKSIGEKLAEANKKASAVEKQLKDTASKLAALETKGVGKG